MDCVTAVDSAIEVRGEAELRLRTAPIYRAARFEMSCTAPDLRTWSVLYEASLTGLRALAPSLLDALASGAKDEAAARELGLSLRTYRRRVAELMAAVGASSRFQAGLRARELGLV